jgi:hypothetical protein
VPGIVAVSFVGGGNQHFTIHEFDLEFFFTINHYFYTIEDRFIIVGFKLYNISIILRDPITCIKRGRNEIPLTDLHHHI